MNVTPMPGLSPEARDALRAVGLTDEQVAEANESARQRRVYVTCEPRDDEPVGGAS